MHHSQNFVLCIYFVDKAKCLVFYHKYLNFMFIHAFDVKLGVIRHVQQKFGFPKTQFPPKQPIKISPMACHKRRENWRDYPHVVSGE